MLHTLLFDVNEVNCQFFFCVIIKCCIDLHATGIFITLVERFADLTESRKNAKISTSRALSIIQYYLVCMQHFYQRQGKWAESCDAPNSFARMNSSFILLLMYRLRRRCYNCHKTHSYASFSVIFYLTWDWTEWWKYKLPPARSMLDIQTHVKDPDCWQATQLQSLPLFHCYRCIVHLIVAR